MENYKEKLTSYYNKFNEDKRLDSRHGQVEYQTSMKFLHEYLKEGMKILDIGAGTGKYSIALSKEGYDVTAVELTRPNIGKLRVNDPTLKIIEADGRDLNMIPDRSFDLIICFGPLYHLHGKQEKEKALAEAKRVLKEDGILFVTYILNDYGVIYHAFLEDQYLRCKDHLDEDFHIQMGNDLYDYVRLEEIDELNQEMGLVSIDRFASDGPSDYMRQTLNKMDEETFQGFLSYHFATCQRKELLGASSHIVDVLKKHE